MKKCQRITVDPRKMGGVPCIRGLRIPVATVVEMVAQGMREPEILKAYPDLERADIRQRSSTPPRRSGSANCLLPPLHEVPRG